MMEGGNGREKRRKVENGRVKGEKREKVEKREKRRGAKRGRGREEGEMEGMG